MRATFATFACSATAVETSPELIAWMAAAAGAWFCIKQAQLSELQPEYSAGNLSTASGDNVGLQLLGRWAAQLRRATSRATVYMREVETSVRE